MSSRKDIGKRQGGVLQRFGNWIAGTKPVNIQQAYRSEGTNSISQWSSTLDDTPLSGDSYVNGTCCKTVGEYKAALIKNDHG